MDSNTLYLAIFSKAISVALLVFTTGLTSSSSSAAERPQFIAKAIEAISSIRSLSAKFTVSTPDSPDWSETYQYHRDGKMVRLELIQGTGVSGTRYVATDGENYYTVSTNEDYTTADVFVSTIGIAKLGRQMLPDYAIGIQVYDADGASLVDALLDPKLHVDDQSLHATLEPFYESRVGGPLRIEAVINQTKGNLPAYVQTTLIDDTSKYLEKWITLSYFEVTDASDGTMRWFPKEIKLEQNLPAVFKISILDATVNPKLPLSLFQPELPEGSQVNDLRIDGKVDSHVVGNDSHLSDMVQEAVKQAKAPSRRGGDLFFYVNVVVITVLGALFAARFLVRRSVV